VIKVKGDDLNGHQSKKMRWHCHKDLMQNDDINFFKRKLRQKHGNETYAKKSHYQFAQL
jgi:hypothetical protein